MNLKTETALVCSAPLFACLAERLARDFSKVYFCSPSGSNFPSLNHGMVGHGLENVEVVPEVFGAHFEEVGLFIFPDLHHGALQVQLEKMGKRVWGGRHGEDFEHQRELMKRRMESLGLPVQTWKRLVGMQALRAHLAENENQHVKVNRWRGLTESFFVQNLELAGEKLADLEHSLGAFRESFPFIVEDDLPDRVEIGLDTYCIDGAYPTRTMCGIEAKDIGYVCQVMDWPKIPEPIRRWNEKLAPAFRRVGYRGFLSNEVRIGEDHEPYMIDATTRMPSPPGELEQELITNLAEVMWAGAAGELIEPQMAGEWGVEVILKSNFARENHQRVEVPKAVQPFVKLYNYCQVDGVQYSLSQHEDMPEIGAVVGYGKTLDEAVAMVKKIGESVEGFGVKFSLGPVDAVKEQISQMVKIGISPFSLDSAEF